MNTWNPTNLCQSSKIYVGISDRFWEIFILYLNVLFKVSYIVFGGRLGVARVDTNNHSEVCPTFLRIQWFCHCCHRAVEFYWMDENLFSAGFFSLLFSAYSTAISRILVNEVFYRQVMGFRGVPFWFQKFKNLNKNNIKRVQYIFVITFLNSEFVGIFKICVLKL